MSAGTMEHIGNALKVKAESNGFLKYRSALIFSSQAVLIVLTYYASFLLRLDTDLDAANRAMFWKTLPFVLVIKLVLSYQCGLMHGWWRYVGISDLLDISKASLLSSSLIFCLVEAVLRLPGYPRSVIIIDLFLTIMVLGGARFAVRAYTERARTYGAQRNTLVVGAGEAGSAIVRELKQNSGLNYNPVGFVDDDLSKKGVKIHGVKVLGSTDELHELIIEYQCQLRHDRHSPGQGPAGGKNYRQMPRVQGGFQDSSAHRRADQQTAFAQPGAPVAGGGSAGTRSRSALDMDQIRGRIADKVLLITGAGGSIGSELVRQAAALDPRQLVLLDRSENDLFKLGHELSRKFPQLDYVPVVGDIQDVTLLREVFATHRPQSVFHAAAYKHVPMMERNCFQAITNNIFGTYNVALLARQYRVEDFVLISSDKAVNPTNIMGVTKRVAELIMQGLQDNGTALHGGAVRQRAGQQRQRLAAVRAADCRRRSGDGHSSRCPALLHDHSRGGATGVAGLQHGPGRRDLCSGYGRAGADSGSGAQPDPALRPGTGPRHQDRLRRLASGRKDVRRTQAGRRGCQAHGA